MAEIRRRQVVYYGCQRYRINPIPCPPKKQGHASSARPLYMDTRNRVGWNDGGPAQRQGFHRSLCQSDDLTTLFDVIPPLSSRRVAR